MWQKLSISALLLCLSVSAFAQPAPLKPRIVVLTDIGPSDIEPGDHEHGAEVGSCQGGIPIADSHFSAVVVHVRHDSAGKRFHVICETTDDGVPSLTSYRRVIVTSKTAVLR